MKNLVEMAKQIAQNVSIAKNTKVPSRGEMLSQLMEFYDLPTENFQNLIDKYAELQTDIDFNMFAMNLITEISTVLDDNFQVYLDVVQKELAYLGNPNIGTKQAMKNKAVELMALLSDEQLTAVYNAQKKLLEKMLG